MRRIFLLLALAMITAMALAQRLTEQQAKERAASFMKYKHGTALAKGAATRAAGLKTVSLGIDGIYLFNVDGGGYVVAGGDARVAPVLGYGDNGTLSANDIPANMKSWLVGYARQVAFAAEHNLDFTARTVAEHQPIEPLLTTTWGQDKPFNLLSPMIDSDDPSLGNCPSGCVATAMAQVANYHKWPVKAEGIGHATDYVGEIYNIDMSNDYFDWDNMLDTYTNTKGEVIAGNEAQWNAVALLMRDMAYSVNMKFEPGGSGTASYDVPFGMVQNLGYDKGAHIESRNLYSHEEWDSLVYDNLSKYGPILYSGDTQSNEGHEFVCDGYRGDGYYHFNWGWDGMSDGYFLLTSLNPGYQGTGGSVENLAFDYSHDMVYGLCKPVEGSQAVVDIYQNGNLMYVDGALRSYFQYLVSQPEELDLGLWTKNLATGEEAFHLVETVEVEKPKFVITFPDNCELADGKYKVMPVFRRTGEEGWHFFKCPKQFRNSLLLDVAEGERTYYTDEPFKIVNVMLSNLYVIPNGTFTFSYSFASNGASHEASLGFRLLDEQTGETIVESEPQEVTFNMDKPTYGDTYRLEVGDVDMSHTFNLQMLDGDRVFAEQKGITAIEKPVLETIEPLSIAEVVDGKIWKQQDSVTIKFKYRNVHQTPLRSVSLDVKTGFTTDKSDLNDYVEITDGDICSLEGRFDTQRLFELNMPVKRLKVKLSFNYDDEHSIPLVDGSDIVMDLEVVADDPTGVEGIAADEPSGEKRIFDLLGRRRNAKAKGLVIVNGELKIKN